MSAVVSVTYFLISLIFNLFIFVLCARIVLRIFRVNPAQPIAKAIFQISDPLLQPLEKHVYPNAKQQPRYDWFGLVLLVVLCLIKFFFLGWLFLGQPLSIAYLGLFAVSDTIVQFCNFFFYALIIRVLLSWMNVQWKQHPTTLLINHITNPLIRLGHAIIPNISGFDFAPLVILAILKIITIVISTSLPLPLL